MNDHRGTPENPRVILGSFIGAAVPASRHDPGVELDWLRTFLAVLDRGGFSAAAEQVHRSQSRVSAHIAALERELGVTLIDRSRRPARVTPAGEILAERARDILAAVGSARSAVGAARGLHEGRVTLLTTPVRRGRLPRRPLGRLACADLGVRFAVREDPHPDVDRRFLDDGVALAVLPAFVVRSAPGLRERILWEEPVRAVVPAGHRLASLPGPVGLAELVREPLVVPGASADGVPEILELLARRGAVAIRDGHGGQRGDRRRAGAVRYRRGPADGGRGLQRHPRRRDSSRYRWPTPDSSAASVPTGTTSCWTPNWQAAADEVLAEPAPSRCGTGRAAARRSRSRTDRRIPTPQRRPGAVAS